MECVFIFAFTSSVIIPVVPLGTKGSVAAIKIFAIAVKIKNYQSLIKKKEHDKIVLLAKTKLNNAEVLISKVLIDSNIGRDEFVDYVLKEHNEMKEEIIKSNNVRVNSILVVLTVVSKSLKLLMMKK